MADMVTLHMRRTVEAFRSAGLDEKADAIEAALALTEGDGQVRVMTPAEPDVADLEPTSEDADDDDVPVDEFEPGKHSVAEVLEYLDAHPDETDAVIAAERDGKNRPTIVRLSEGDDD